MLRLFQCLCFVAVLKVAVACQDALGLHCLRAQWNCPIEIFATHVTKASCMDSCCRCTVIDGDAATNPNVTLTSRQNTISHERACTPNDLQPDQCILTNPDYRCDFCPSTSDGDNSTHHVCVRQRELGFHAPLLDEDNHCAPRSASALPSACARFAPAILTKPVDTQHINKKQDIIPVIVPDPIDGAPVVVPVEVPPPVVVPVDVVPTPDGPVVIAPTPDGPVIIDGPPPLLPPPGVFFPPPPGPFDGPFLPPPGVFIDGPPFGVDFGPPPFGIDPFFGGPIPIFGRDSSSSIKLLDSLHSNATVSPQNKTSLARPRAAIAGNGSKARTKKEHLKQ